MLCKPHLMWISESSSPIIIFLISVALNFFFLQGGSSAMVTPCWSSGMASSEAWISSSPSCYLMVSIRIDCWYDIHRKQVFNHHSYLLSSASQIVLKVQQHGTPKPPWGKSAEYCLSPVTTHTISPPYRIIIKQTMEISLGTWPTMTLVPELCFSTVTADGSCELPRMTLSTEKYVHCVWSCDLPIINCGLLLIDNQPI